MGNPIRDTKGQFDKADLAKSIEERQLIIDRYVQTGFFDRNDAIRKIVELRRSDAKVGVIYAASPKGRPLEEYPDSVLVENLKMQVTILAAELAEKELGTHG